MTQVFISYAREDFRLAEGIAVKLQYAGYSVFYDRAKITPGVDADAVIEESIKRCVLFIFLASGSSIAAGRYSLTELSIAQERWPVISDSVLAVLVDDAIARDLPPYLTGAAAPLRPRGDIATEVRREAIRRLRSFHVTPVLKPAREPRSTSAPAGPSPLTATELTVLASVAEATFDADQLPTLRSIKGPRLMHEALVGRLLHDAYLCQWQSDYCYLQTRSFQHVASRFGVANRQRLSTLATHLATLQERSPDKTWSVRAIAQALAVTERQVALTLLHAQQEFSGALTDRLVDGLPQRVRVTDDIFAAARRFSEP